MVNRIWHYNFGRGIVATPGDFGLMGSRPTHPELLDYLATYFVENGWSMKKLHRMILLSNTYQQSSDFRRRRRRSPIPTTNCCGAIHGIAWKPKRFAIPCCHDCGLLNDKWAAPAFSRRSLQDVATALSATAAAGGWRKEKDPAQNNRRSVYIFVRRNLRYPMLQEFDSANTFESCDFRKNTVTALAVAGSAE